MPVQNVSCINIKSRFLPSSRISALKRSVLHSWKEISHGNGGTYRTHPEFFILFFLSLFLFVYSESKDGPGSRWWLIFPLELLNKSILLNTGRLLSDAPGYKYCPYHLLCSSKELYLFCLFLSLKDIVSSLGKCGRFRPCHVVAY